MKSGNQWALVAVILVLCPCPGNLQLDSDARNNFRFEMDTTRDCNNQAYNIYDKEATIVGQSAGEVQEGPLSCTLMLETESNFEKKRFRVHIRAMQIQDQDVTFTIYDGEPGSLLLDAYDSTTSGQRPDRITTGTKVTFVLGRRDNRNTQYNIEVVATPIVAGQDPGYENDWGNDYGYFNRLVPNMVIYICVGVGFVVIIVIILVVSIVCHRKHKGLTKKPEQYKISYINTNPSVSRGPPSEASTKQWVSTSRNSLRRERKGHRNYDDDDSVFDGSVDSVPSKKRYDLDESYENRRYPRQESSKPRPGYRNNSYVQADDDHSQGTYIERELKPRVKSSKPRYEEEEEEEEDDDDLGPDEHEEEVEDEEEEEEETEEEETEEEEEEDDDQDEDVSPQTLPDQPPPRLTKQPTSGVPQPAPRHFPHDQPNSFPGDPRQMPVPGPYGPPYMMYPGQRPQFMPMPPAHFQPIHGPTMSMPPPRYPGQPHNQPKPYQVKPTDPPVYSYLVQRGYNPDDGRESPVSVSTNASAKSDTRLIQPEDSDMSAHNLDAGVEYMRR